MAVRAMDQTEPTHRHLLELLTEYVEERLADADEFDNADVIDGARRRFRGDAERHEAFLGSDILDAPRGGVQ